VQIQKEKIEKDRINLNLPKIKESLTMEENVDIKYLLPNKRKTCKLYWLLYN